MFIPNQVFDDKPKVKHEGRKQMETNWKIRPFISAIRSVGNCQSEWHFHRVELCYQASSEPTNRRWNEAMWCGTYQSAQIMIAYWNWIEMLWAFWKLCFLSCSQSGRICYLSSHVSIDGNFLLFAIISLILYSIGQIIDNCSSINTDEP